MAAYPWIVLYEAQGRRLEDLPILRRWFEAFAARPAAIAPYEKGKAIHDTSLPITYEAKKTLFGQTPVQTAR